MTFFGMHRPLYATCVAAGALIIAACFLPGFELGLDGYVGAGESQVGFDFVRTFRIGRYPAPESFFLLAAGALVAGVGLVGLALRDTVRRVLLRLVGWSLLNLLVPPLAVWASN